MLWSVLWPKNRHFRISIALKLRDFDSKRRAIKTNGYIGMCANLVHIFLIFCHIFEILKINYFSGFTALRSDRAIRYFYFFKLLYFVNTFE